MDLYERLGVKTFINAGDAASEFGGSRMEMQTFVAMRDAASSFVDIDQLHAEVGKRIALLTGNEAAFVTSGMAASLLMACAVCMVRHPEPELFAMLPDTQHFRNEFIVLRGHSGSGDFAITAVGGIVIPVGNENGVTESQILDAITSRTAGIVLFVTQPFASKCPPMRKICLLAHMHDLYLVVEASEQLPPKENLWMFTASTGADLALFAAGKALKGPSQGGIVVGRRALVDMMRMIAPPHTGIAHAATAGREEIVGVYVALQSFLLPGALEERLRDMLRMCERIAKQLEASGGFKTTLIYPGPTGQTYRRLGVEVLGGVCARTLRDRLLDNGIIVELWEWHNGIIINTLNLMEEEVQPLIVQVLAQYALLRETEEEMEHGHL